MKTKKILICAAVTVFVCLGVVLPSLFAEGGGTYVTLDDDYLLSVVFPEDAYLEVDCTRCSGAEATGEGIIYGHISGGVSNPSLNVRIPPWHPDPSVFSICSDTGDDWEEETYDLTLFTYIELYDPDRLRLVYNLPTCNDKLAITLFEDTKHYVVTYDSQVYEDGAMRGDNVFGWTVSD